MIHIYHACNYARGQQPHMVAARRTTMHTLLNMALLPTSEEPRDDRHGGSDDVALPCRRLLLLAGSTDCRRDG